MKAAPEFPGVEQVIQIFGCWPSFHDAEIKWMRLDRRGSAECPGAILEFVIHCFEMTKEIAPNGHYVLRKHTLVHFRFGGISDLNLEGFNQQNAISGLEILDESDPSWERRPFFKVTMEPSFGLSGSFHTVYPEVISAVPCGEKGEGCG